MLDSRKGGEVAYEAFRRSFGMLDPVNGTRTVVFEKLPVRVQQGWMAAAGAVLAEVSQVAVPAKEEAPAVPEVPAVRPAGHAKLKGGKR